MDSSFEAIRSLAIVVVAKMPTVPGLIWHSFSVWSVYARYSSYVHENVSQSTRETYFFLCARRVLVIETYG